jgi:predicted GNAT superfamily acetyltransferase
MLNIRDFIAQDLVAIHATNEANLPHVNSLNLEQFTELANKTAYFKVAIVDGELAGFLMAMTITTNGLLVNMMTLFMSIELSL